MPLTWSRLERVNLLFIHFFFCVLGGLCSGRSLECSQRLLSLSFFHFMYIPRQAACFGLYRLKQRR